MTARTLLFFLFVCVFCVSALPQEAPPAKAARLLNESGVKYSKIADGIWAVPFEGKALKHFSVVISTTEDVLLMFVITAEAKRFRAAPELMQKLLNLNTEFDRVKIGLDKGDIITRIDVGIRLLDKLEFQENLDQTAAAADQVFAAVKPFLITGK